ncbi:GH36-type glycosyl hydrolase domain-containing protein [Hathewaya histolytica]|uniref:GH36-type glycosyl hydrolase domain-containing protein n=1 Tax=Hathewaya histolytica TaxID=1498 RepID=UPI003B6709C1
MNSFFYFEILTIFLAFILLIILIFKYKFYKEENVMNSIQNISTRDHEKLEKHAQNIPEEYLEKKKINTRKNLMKNLDHSFNNIVTTYNFMEKEVRDKKVIVPAAEWLLDNLYLIEKEYKNVKESLPKSYYKELPLMQNGMLRGYPKAYHIAVQIVSHTEGEIDEDIIKRFIISYQKNTILTMAELWAIPVMIRIALIQNISRVCEKIVFIQEERTKAEFFGDNLINAFNDEKLKDELQRMYKLKVDFNPFFTERLLKLLRDNGVDNHELYSWIEEKLDRNHTTFEYIVSNAHKRQSYYELSLGNSISSIRKMEALSWEHTFEELCSVHYILSKDPVNQYMKMDFKSRDFYRHEISKISKKIDISEVFIAKKALKLAKENSGDKDYLNHVGYYIIDDGKIELIRSLKEKRNILDILKDYITKYKVPIYLLATILITLMVTSVFLNISYIRDADIRYSKYIVAFLVIIIPCSEIGISIFNWIITHLMPISFVPKLELKEGISKENSTVVIIPTLITSRNTVKKLISDLEVYYLSNREDNLYFAILGDFKDSKHETEENDKEIIDLALNETNKLNDKYGFKEHNKFFFLCRYRKFNESEGYFLGWERKRGKIAEFNLLLRGSKDTTYNVISSNIENLKKAKYIITLDADTILPRDTAKKLIGSMEHVLNRPYLNEDNTKVLRGYGLMQPRISVSTVSGNKTMFSKVLSGETGIDTYSTAVSDLYQDLFGEGIFTGKGIYNIDVFISTIKGQIPENTVLSHDLLEGSYMRTALVSDIELIDSYPAYYNSSSKRLHRWVRGDWQLLKWLGNTRLNLLSKWKIFDNLRRSLVSPFLMITILFGLLNILPNGIDKWFMVAFLTIVVPVAFSITENIVAPMKGISVSGRLNTDKMVLNQFLFIFAFLPHKACMMVDAIFRSLYRILISKKNLLQWQTAEAVEKSVGTKLNDFIKFMWFGSFISLLILFLSFIKSAAIGMVMIVPCTIWFLSPLLAYYSSLPLTEQKESLLKEDVFILRRISRKTWAYFEDFVNEENNWLGPDNFQENPPNGVAHRTSPTNIGMTLTSNIVALDMGYIGLLQCLERLDNTVISMNNLSKYKGHFYNWYNTLTSEPLYPRFVSTVDSGNLVGYLWLCSETLEEELNLPYVNKRIKIGLKDTLSLSKNELNQLLGESNELNNISISEEIDANIISWRKDLLNILKAVNSIYEREEKHIYYWTYKLKKDIQNHIQELDKTFPWIKILDEGEVSEEIKNKLIDIPSKISLKNIPEILYTLEDDLINKNNGVKEDLIDAVKASRIYIVSIIDRINSLSMELYNIAEETDFKFLYDKDKNLFSIGFDMENNKINKSYYDLLASESRQASFVAIAKGEIPKEHWFKLGRSMTFMGRSKGLVSWSGTMFEYFMPLLIMKTYPHTILDRTYRSVIEGQIKYAKRRGVPFGISESGFYTFDINKNYQYKAFGVPGIGLKRGLINELVISPYSTILSLQKELKHSLINIKRLIKAGLEGTYGFYEAIDYTKNRVNKESDSEIVKSYMIHHQGMSLMAIDNVLNKNILQNRFHNIPLVKSTELLLQEKIPNKVLYDREYKFDLKESKFEKQRIITRTYKTAKTSVPEVQLLSNDNLHLMVSNSGSGYTKLQDTFLYRWREDVTEDNTGLYVYIKDNATKDYWSATYAPTMEEGEDYEVTFSIDKAEFKKTYKNILCKTKISVSKEDDVEIRKLTLKNLDEQDKIIEVISYAEVVLAGYDGDLVHQAFSNLFITTEFVDNPEVLICKRRPRAKGKEISYLMHTMAVKGEILDDIEYETARLDFIGRGRNKKQPIALEREKLSNSSGVVLDPIISLKRKIRIPKGEKIEVAFVTGYCRSRSEAINLAEKYSDMNIIKRQYALSFNSAQMEMRYLGIKSPQVNLYQNMASRILYLSPLMRAREEYIKNIIKSQNTLWSYGISGDLPIVVLKINSENNIGKLNQLLNAHEYLTLKGLKLDLVVIDEEENSYHQVVHKSIMDTIYSNGGRDKLNKSGGIFVLNKSLILGEDIELLKALARIVIDAEGDFIKSQISTEDPINTESNLEINNVDNEPGRKLELPPIKFYNNYGGFSEDGREYIIHITEGKNTPTPWINVISNENFGFHVSESGSAYTWSGNSRENKITHWNNDWICDTPSEVLYIKDEESKNFWSITPRPIRDRGDYSIIHGFGYSKFMHNVCGIECEETMFVAMDKKLKLIKVRLKNTEKKKRVLSPTYYARLVKGVVPEHTADRIVTFYDSSGFLYAKNPYSMNFKDIYSYIKILGVDNISYTGSRTEFIGRMGDVTSPEAMKKEKLSNTVGAGMDPCFAMKGDITIEAGEEKEITILFGEEEEFKSIENIIKFYEINENVDVELQKTISYWKDILGRIKVKTPEKSLDIMVNGWLMYQNISCRLWARTAFYQSGGAFGFRDQLQDVLSILYLDSNITREQILYSASRQFYEGDVQHWWHPIVDSGIRTRFSDDLLWLPYVTLDYIKSTGDYSILDEKVGYLEDDPLREGEDERYTISRKSQIKEDIYTHCIKSIERALKFGVHNIPLMGSGDWNDGMSTVGNKGRGESVWVGWFLYSILKDFYKICEYKKDEEKCIRYKNMQNFIKVNLNKNAWDGNWYRRAYFDDGTPLGSSENEECKIDSISQSWAIISGGGEKEKIHSAIKYIEKYLIKEEEGLILLLTPPFYKSELEPGYIKGYVPGVRENGGQYTHASTWVILAMCHLKQYDKALKLFNMINPINHTDTEEKCNIYKTEPYVMSADVYGVEPHVGRGGWSWYTGTAGWMYKVALEGILGLKLKGKEGFYIEPCVPNDWKEYSIDYSKDETLYKIKVRRGNDKKVIVDDKVIKGNIIPYLNDKKTHIVEVII